MPLLYIFIGFLIAIASLILLVWGIFVYVYKRLTRLQAAETRVMATVTRIEIYSPDPSRKTYRLFAQWQQPQTRKIFTYQANIKNLDRFPVGSLVPVLIDTKHPRWNIPEFLEQDA